MSCDGKAVMGRFNTMSYNDIIVCLPCMLLRNGQSPMWQLTENTTADDIARELYEHRDHYHHDMFIGDMWEFASNLEITTKKSKPKAT